MLLAALICATALSDIIEQATYAQVMQPDSGRWLVLLTSGTDPRVSEFRAAAADPKTAGLHYALVDCRAAAAECAKFNVSAEAAIRYVDAGREKQYQWEENFAGYFAFGHKVTNPVVYNLQRQSVFENFRRYEFSFLLWFYPQSVDSGHIQKSKLVEKVAADYHHTQVYFGMAADPSLRDLEGISFADLPIVKRYGSDEPFDFNITDFDEGSLRAFIERHKWGLMPAVNTSLWSALHSHTRETGQILLLAFTNGSNYTQYTTYIHSLKMASWSLRKAGDFRFQMAAVDMELYPGLGTAYGVDSTPAIVAVDQRNGSKVEFGYFSPEDKGDTIRFLKAIWEGKPIVKTLNRPEGYQKRVELTTGIPKISYGEMWIIVAVIAAVGVWCVPKRKTGRKKTQ